MAESIGAGGNAGRRYGGESSIRVFGSADGFFYGKGNPAHIGGDSI